MRISRFIVAALLVATAACGDGGDGRGGSTVVVTTGMLGDVVEELVDGAVPVETVIPRGASPHEFQASARQVDAMSNATALVVNGAGLEEGIVDVIEAARTEGVPVHEAITSVATRTFGDGDAVDPHFFTDPVRMADAVSGIAAFLLDSVPELDAVTVGAAEARLRAELLALHDELAAVLAAVPDERRFLVTNHDAFGYFADRYGFDVVGTIIPTGSTTDATDARDLAALAALVDRLDLPAVFSEESVSDELARTLAAEIGHPVAVVPLYAGSLGPAGSEAATYAGLLRADARRIAEALS